MENEQPFKGNMCVYVSYKGKAESLTGYHHYNVVFKNMTDYLHCMANGFDFSDIVSTIKETMLENANITDVDCTFSNFVSERDSSFTPFDAADFDPIEYSGPSV